MNSLRFAYDYLNYYLTAKNKHDIHSPFVFDFTTKVLNNDKHEKKFDKVEYLRRKLRSDNAEISFSDFGAGSSRFVKNKSTISVIAKNSAKQFKYARLLYRTVNYFKPQNMLELGTSLGISTLYQAMANPQSNFITIEGSDSVAKIAQQNFDACNVNNVKLINGLFDEQLPEILKQLKGLDYVFFDGNHRKEPTLKYFEMCLQKASPSSIFIFDDINWSKEMKQAWTEIKNHQRVLISIDLFVMGIVFFNPDFSKQQFVIRF